MQVDLLPIQPHIKVAMEAIDRDAAICPALDELYSLLGHDKAQQDHEDVAKLMELVPGITAIKPKSLPTVLPKRRQEKCIVSNS